MKKFMFTATILSLVLILNTQFASAAGQVSSDRTSIPVNKYVIKRGDNLWNIARRFHCTVRQLKDLNPQIEKGQPNNNIVKPDETITIPETETLTDMEAGVLTLVNQIRANAGLNQLQGNDNALNKTARAKAKDMAENNYFSHNSPTHGTPFDMMRSFGVSYRSAGENIATGQKTPQEVMDAWMASSGHRANILNTQYTHCGVGYVNGKWVQMFVQK